MSGHSKWSQIKHKKGISDLKKGNVFSKLSKLITIAAKDGTDPSANNKLQSIIERARAENMPKDNIERAIQKSRDKDAANLKEIILQAVGPAGSGFIIEAVTDNSNRTIQEIKKILGDHETKMAAEGSLDWMFERRINKELSTQQLEFIALYPVTIEDQTILNKITQLMEALDDQDDVQNIYTNVANL